MVVDDLLPTVDNVLLTTQAGAENEFWAPLVEKAYAKYVHHKGFLSIMVTIISYYFILKTIES